MSCGSTWCFTPAGGPHHSVVARAVEAQDGLHACKGSGPRVEGASRRDCLEASKQVHVDAERGSSLKAAKWFAKNPRLVANRRLTVKRGGLQAMQSSKAFESARTALIQTCGLSEHQDPRKPTKAAGDQDPRKPPKAAGDQDPRKPPKAAGAGEQAKVPVMRSKG